MASVFSKLASTVLVLYKVCYSMPSYSVTLNHNDMGSSPTPVTKENIELLVQQVLLNFYPVMVMHTLSIQGLIGS